MCKIIFSIFLFLFPSIAYPIYFNHIGINEGLAQLSVMSIHQDEFGRMWFGTTEGISIYDGDRIITYKTIRNPDASPISLSPGFRPGYRVNAIVSDRHHNVYTRLNNSLIRYDIKKQRFSAVRERRVTALSAIDGDIWYAMYDSVFVWNDSEKSSKFIFKMDARITINEIHMAKNKTLWLGTASGLYSMNAMGQISNHIPRKDIYKIFEASNGDIWIGCRMEGMYRINNRGEITEYSHNPNNSNSIASDQVRTFAEGNNGEIWIGTFNGLQEYNIATGKYTNYIQNKLPGGLTHSSVFSLYKDRQGTIWAGTYYGGVNYFNPESDIFTHYTDGPRNSKYLSYSFVGNMVEDRNNNLWICTEGGGLNKLDRKTGQITQFRSEHGSNSIAHNNLKSICYDSIRHALYIGTHTGGLSKYDIDKNRFTNYLQITRNGTEAPNEVIHKVGIYNDSLIVLARNGLFVMDLQTEKMERLFPALEVAKTYGVDFLIDSKGYIWISKLSNITRIKINNPSENETFNNGEHGLGYYPTKGLFETQAGEVYIGTQGSGLFRFNEQEHVFLRYTLENGDLASNYCYKIAQTKQGNLIISTNKGVFLFNPQQGLIESINLGNKDLLITSIYESCGLYVCQNGEIFVGGADGLTSFFEEDLPKRDKPYNIYFSELYISNRKIFPDCNTGVLTEELPYTNSIVLNHKQNNLIFHFASNNYVGTLSKSTYEYFLEGFDTEWVQTNRKNIYYTNLNPGDYVLRVREKDMGQHFSPPEIQLAFTIRRPIYTTPWAYLLYFLITAGIISTFAYFKYSKMRLAASLLEEKREKERIEELNQSKLRFFTNISHEFRTPLTLIISQIELLLQNTTLSPTIYNKVLKVYKNTYQMRNLITELLDFRKFEQKHVTLNISEQDMIAFLKEIYLSYYEFSLSHGINYQFCSKQEHLSCWFDPKQMQKVFYNLLSNAFKYTSTNGFIEVNIREEEEDICVKIIDNGVGIDKKDLNRIFDRFYQVDSIKNTGTGIGLALTKSIVESHHGLLSIESRLGYGSIFCVRLKKGNEHFSGDSSAIILSGNNVESIEPDTLPDPLLIETMIEAETILPTLSDDETKPKILIVEDNEELLITLSDLFNPLYHVALARNGEEGLRKTIDELPDLVLSDVMMPIMSGTEMCLRIKSNLDISHIPVVLLTALSSNEQNMEGLQRGADDYIGKPFNAKLLFARCNNLIRNRRLLQKKYYDQSSVDINLLATNQLDHNFMDKVEAIIKDNIDNVEFDINKLAKEMALGRSTLFAKFKGLTGMTPNEFILNYKLKQAAILLRKHKDMQIAEISDSLGFSSPRYFGKCFKNQFSVSPLEYRKKIWTKNDI